MEEKNTELNLKRYWPFWNLHFGIHIILGLVASIAGTVVIFTVNDVLSGLALIGAGSFAIINGWQGCKELGKNTGNHADMNSKESHR